MSLREEPTAPTARPRRRGARPSLAFVLRLLLLLACALVTTLALGGCAPVADARRDRRLVHREPADAHGDGGRRAHVPPDASRQRPRDGAPRRARRADRRAGVRRGAACGPASPELVPIAFVGVVVSALFDRRVSLLIVALITVLLAAQPAYHTPCRAAGACSPRGASAALAVRASLRRDQSYLWMIIVAAVSSVAVTATGVAAGAPTPELLSRGDLRDGHVGGERDRGDAVPPLGGAAHRPRDAPHAARVGRSPSSAAAAAEPRGAGYVRAHDRDREPDRGGVPRHRRQRDPRRASARTTTTSASSASRSTSWRIRRADGIPHDQLKPDTSASIIRNHVREGLELADEVRLPATIRAFITEHHGTARSRTSWSGRAQRDGVRRRSRRVRVSRARSRRARDRDRDARRRRGGGGARLDGADARAHPRGDRPRGRAALRPRVSCARRRSRCASSSVVKREFARVLGGMYHARVEYPEGGRDESSPRRYEPRRGCRDRRRAHSRRARARRVARRARAAGRARARRAPLDRLRDGPAHRRAESRAPRSRAAPPT